jgi:hypothetical protein
VPPSAVADHPDSHTGSHAGTAADFDRVSGTSGTDYSIDDPVSAIASNSPLWAVPSAATAGVASQLLDGLKQPHKAFGNAHTPLWAGLQEDLDSIVSNSGDGDGAEIFHGSQDATGFYAPVDVVNSTSSDIGTVDWQLSFSEWEQQRKSNVAIETHAHAQEQAGEYSRSRSNRRLRRQQRRNKGIIRTSSVAKVQPSSTRRSVPAPVSHPKPRRVVAYAGAGAPANWRKRQAVERKARTASGLVFIARQEREHRQQEEEAVAAVFP